MINKTQAEADETWALQVAALTVADAAARKYAEEGEGSPLDHLIRATPEAAAWAFASLYTTAVVHGSDEALDRALDAVRAQAEAATR